MAWQRDLEDSLVVVDPLHPRQLDIRAQHRVTTGRSLHRDRQVKLTYNTQYNTCSERLLYREVAPPKGRSNSPKYTVQAFGSFRDSLHRDMQVKLMNTTDEHLLSAAPPQGGRSLNRDVVGGKYSRVHILRLSFCTEGGRLLHDRDHLAAPPQGGRSLHRLTGRLNSPRIHSTRPVISSPLL